MNYFQRRKFLRIVFGFPIIGALCTCGRNKKLSVHSGGQILVPDPKAKEVSAKMNADQLAVMLNQRAAMVMEKYHNCAQSSFYTLSEQFGLGGDNILKALTPLPGIAERGETCGAITGCLMAMGLVFGRSDPENWQQYRNSLKPTAEFVRKFENATGSTFCRNIQKHIFGMSYDLTYAEDVQAFQRAEATVKCTKVVQMAVNLAAEIIIRDGYEGG